MLTFMLKLDKKDESMTSFSMIAIKSRKLIFDFDSSDLDCVLFNCVLEVAMIFVLFSKRVVNFADGS